MLGTKVWNSISVVGEWNDTVE